MERDDQVRQTGIWVKISQIMLYFPQNAKDEEKKQRLSQLEGIRKDVETGKLIFADAAKSYSQGASAVTGGSVGWVSLYSLDSSLKDWVRTQKPGSLSPVLETGQGAHLALLEDWKENQAADSPNRKAEFQGQLLMLKKQEALAAFVKVTSQKTKIEWREF